jgi:hypothetical protein
MKAANNVPPGGWRKIVPIQARLEAIETVRGMEDAFSPAAESLCRAATNDWGWSDFDERIEYFGSRGGRSGGALDSRPLTLSSVDLAKELENRCLIAGGRKIFSFYPPTTETRISACLFRVRVCAIFPI